MNHVLPRASRIVVAIVAVAAAAATGSCSRASAPDDPRAGSPGRTSMVVVTLGQADDDPFTATAIAGARATAASLDASLKLVESSSDRLDGDVQDALATSPDVIVGIGDATLAAIDPAAASNLDHQFVVVGGEAAEPTANLTTAVFRDHEALYLTGVEAAVMTRSGTVGVAAPPSNPLVDAWVATFASGVRSAGARVEVAEVSGSSSTAAVSDLTARKADVMQAVQLGTTLLDSTRDRPSFAAGADGCSDRPVVDSVVTHADQAFDLVVRDVLAGRTGGVHSFGLAEDAITLASLDGSDDCLIAQDPAALDAVRAARATIVDGSIEVPDPDFVR
jgi:basic membrane protein A